MSSINILRSQPTSQVQSYYYTAQLHDNSLHTLHSYTNTQVSKSILQIIQECVGYTYKSAKRSWNTPLDYMTRAIVWFAIHFLPYLHGLWFTTSVVQMPGLATSLLAQCPLQQAKYVLVKVVNTSLLLRN